MNEASQIIEQIAPRFNPSINIDIWDADNLNEPTRVPLKLIGIDLDGDEYSELSTNIFNVAISVALTGNLYAPIKTIKRINEFQIKMNELHGEDSEFFKETKLTGWDVDNEGIVGDINIEEIK
jgi:hypothetical protein